MNIKLTFHGNVFKAFPRSSPLVQAVSEAILLVRESGQMRELENSLIASSKCPSSDNDDKSDRLSLESFISLFVITIGTSTVVLVLFFFRRLQYYGEMYMSFCLLFLIHQMHAYWQMLTSVYRLMVALEIAVLRQDPDGGPGVIRRHVELVEPPNE